MNILSRIRLKWIAYGLELFLIYIAQSTPNLLPSFLGVKPLLLIVFSISISMFEGRDAAIWIGLASGALMDLSSSKVFGFYTLMLMTVCFVAGTLVVFLMRSNIVSAMVLGITGLLFIGLCRWFFFYALWGDPKTWYYLYAIMLPQIVYTAAIMPIAFYFTRTIATRLASEE